MNLIGDVTFDMGPGSAMRSRMALGLSVGVNVMVGVSVGVRVMRRVWVTVGVSVTVGVRVALAARTRVRVGSVSEAGEAPTIWVGVPLSGSSVAPVTGVAKTTEDGVPSRRDTVGL